MFEPASGPLDFAEVRLQGLRASLNVPVVHAEGLPVGPARAAVALLAGANGPTRLVVALRSQVSGELAYFECVEDLNEFTSPDLLLESAVRFAEALGFVFDEDLLKSRDPADRECALSQWRSFASDSAATLAVPLPQGAGEASELADPDEVAEEQELLLVELAESEPDAPPAECESSASRPSAATVPLTKFRRSQRPAAVAAAARRRSAPPAGGSALGRVPIVQRRVDAEAPKRPSLLLRLLGTF